MIGTGLRAFARKKGLKIAHGVAYGSLYGYCSTLYEGMGTKTLVLATGFPNEEAGGAFAAYLQSVDAKETYKISTVEIQPKLIHVIFHDTIGTMKRIEAFVEQVIPAIDRFGGSKLNVCSQCGMAITGEGSWKLVNGIAIYVHESCGERIRSTIEVGKDQRQEKGSYATGALGAFLGALGGSVLWTILMYMGYIASWVGLFMGFLGERCYCLFRGKEGRGKVVILILAVVFGVLVGNFAEKLIAVLVELDLSFGESVSHLWGQLCSSTYARSSFLRNTVVGLIFAAIGTFGMMVKTKTQVSVPGYLDLE